MINFALSLLAASSSHAAIAKVPAACYTMSRKAAVEQILTSHPEDGAFARNTDFARRADDGAIYIVVWVKRHSQEFADGVHVYVHGDGLNCVIDYVSDQ